MKNALVEEKISEFSEWMKENIGTLSEASIYKYSRAINTISEDMIRLGIIDKNILFMSELQFDKYMPVIFNQEKFISKDKKGNKMYSNALKQYRMFRVVNHDTAVDNIEIQGAIDDYEGLDATERDAIVKSRIGQGLFKNKLLEKYNSRCIITGISTKRLLIASHIKPWAVCNNDERLSEENGLLLSPTFDKLFDCGLISFSDAGKIIISSQLNPSDVVKLNIDSEQTYDLKISYQLKQHLEYHRDTIFVRR